MPAWNPVHLLGQTCHLLVTWGTATGLLGVASSGQGTYCTGTEKCGRIHRCKCGRCGRWLCFSLILFLPTFGNFCCFQCETCWPSLWVRSGALGDVWSLPHICGPSNSPKEASARVRPSADDWCGLHQCLYLFPGTSLLQAKTRSEINFI